MKLTGSKAAGWRRLTGKRWHMLALFLVAAMLTASCPDKGGPAGGGKSTPLQVLSETYKPYTSNVKDGMKDVDLSALQEPQRVLALKVLNEIPCACGCRRTTVAECRVKVTDCDMGKQQADYIVEQVKNGLGEGQVARGLYELILRQRLRGGAAGLLNAISPNSSKRDMAAAIARLLQIDVGSINKTGNELVDARQVAKLFLEEQSGILKYLEGAQDELYLIHGITFELLVGPRQSLFEYFFFQNNPKLQDKTFEFFNPNTPEAEMIIGMAETIFQEAKPRTGIKVDLGQSPNRGPATAPITIVEYSDFQCTYCQKTQPTIQQFWDQNPGKVFHIFKNFPLVSIHPSAEPAARAALAANKQGKFWEYRKLLFENQQNLSQQTFEQFAQQLGMNLEQFKADMESPEIKALIQKDMQEALKIGVQSTPTFIINGTEVQGARSICTFVEAAQTK